jgi:hypothetical protein
MAIVVAAASRNQCVADPQQLADAVHGQLTTVDQPSDSLRRYVKPSGDSIDVMHLRDAGFGDDSLVRHASPAAVFVARASWEISAAACSRAA